MIKLLIESHQFSKFWFVFVLITYKSAYIGNACFCPPQSGLDYFNLGCFFISYITFGLPPVHHL